MKSFVSFPLIIALFFSLQISYAQDFLDDLYIVNINYNPIYSNNDQQDIIDEDVIYEDVISDTLSDYGYDDELDYEDRIMKFHNPHYRFRYCLDYGWHNPYWSNWHYPSWSLNYHSYGHHWGWGLSYGYNWNYPSWAYGWNYPSWAYGWNYPSWAYGWNYPHGYYSASYYNYSGINNWQNNIFYTANNNISGHRDPSNPYISSKPNIGQNTERTEGKKRDIVSQIRPGTNKNVQKPNRNNTSKKPNNFVNKITDQIINSSKHNTNRNTNSNKNNNRNSNFNSNKNNNRNSNFNSNRSNSRSSSPNRSSNNRSRRN